jgi:cell wall integrity and stress response component
MTWTPTPVTSLETITGMVHTVTVTPTVPPNSQETLNPVSRKSGGGLSTGGAVGLTVGLVALVALVCAIVYFCIRKRQKDRADEKDADRSRRESSTILGGPIPSRTMSENSRYILNTDGRQVVESYEGDLPGSRRSRLVPVDPRLNPHAPLYQRGDNKSRESVNTIRDDHDYSRRVHQQGPILRVTNSDD